VPDEEADNKYREQYFNFYDARLMGTEWAKQPNRETTMQFFRLLALCHTVIPDGEPGSGVVARAGVLAHA
jgi:phospholipid-transporting ATPase